jgi:hypothetical protein
LKNELEPSTGSAKYTNLYNRIFTIYIKLVGFEANTAVKCFPRKETVSELSHKFVLIRGIETPNKSIGVQFSSFAIILIEDILLVESKSRWLTGVTEVLSPFSIVRT